MSKEEKNTLSSVYLPAALVMFFFLLAIWIELAFFYSVICLFNPIAFLEEILSQSKIHFSLPIKTSNEAFFHNGTEIHLIVALIP